MQEAEQEEGTSAVWKRAGEKVRGADAREKNLIQNVEKLPESITAQTRIIHRTKQCALKDSVAQKHS